MRGMSAGRLWVTEVWQENRKPSLDTIRNWPVSIFTHALMLSTSTRRRFYERFLRWCQDSQQLLAWLARILMITELWFNWLDFFEDLCFLGEEAVSASRRQYFALLRPVCHVLKNQGTTTVYILSKAKCNSQIWSSVDYVCSAPSSKETGVYIIFIYRWKYIVELAISIGSLYPLSGRLTFTYGTYVELIMWRYVILLFSIYFFVTILPHSTFKQMQSQIQQLRSHHVFHFVLNAPF